MIANYRTNVWSDRNPLHYKKMTSTINLEGKTLSSTIAKLNAPLMQAFDPRLSSESTDSNNADADV